MVPQAAAAALRSIARPLSRVVAGVLAARLIRFVLKRVGKVKVLDQELEKDLELWFRASLVMLLSTANVEHILFGWIPFDLQASYAWLGIAFRLLLVVGVIETMPDQAIFSLIHRGPPPLPMDRMMFKIAWQRKWEYLGGVINQHLKRSSPVLAILAAIFGGQHGTDAFYVGWTCYFMAIAQYLYMALVTSHDMAHEALTKFDTQISEIRAELAKEIEAAQENEATLRADAAVSEGDPPPPERPPD